MPLRIALLAGALAAVTALPEGAPVATREPDVAKELGAFSASPPEWSADVVNALVGFGPNSWLDRQQGWLVKPENWLLIDYMDRAGAYTTHGWLTRRGIAEEHYGFNEYQETIHLRAATALELFGERGLARGPMGELVLDPLEGLSKRAYVADPLEPRWAALLAYDTGPSARFGDAISQDNIGGAVMGAGPSAIGRFGDAAARGFAAWRERRGEPALPPIREYLRQRHAADLAALRPYAPVAAYDYGRASAAAQSLCDDPVLADFEVYRIAAHLAVWARLYTNMRSIAARDGRAFDVHGNLAGGLLGFDAYPFSLAPLVDTLWFESSGIAQQDQFFYRRRNALGALRLELATAVADGSRASMFLGVPGKVTPDLLLHELAEVSAGGGVPLASPDMILQQAPAALPAYEGLLQLRDRHRSVFLPRGRSRLADVALLYSVATVMFEPCVPDASSTDTPALNDLSGAARALEDGHVPYDVVVLPHPELTARAPRDIDLARYRVVIAPSLARLADADLERLTRYLRGGGTLAVIGNLAGRDERNQRRAGDTLAKLRSAGRVVTLVGGTSFPASRNSDSSLARDLGARLLAELAPLLPEPRVSGDLPATTWVKTWRHAAGFVSAHFVSYSLDYATGTARPTPPARVRLRLPDDVRAQTASWLVPGEPEVQLAVRLAGHYAEVTLPALRVYGVLVLGPAGAEARASALARGDERLARARRAGAGAPALDERIARVTALRAGNPRAFDEAAGALLLALSAERESAYLDWVRSLADFGDPEAAFSFGQGADIPPWKAVGPETSYSRTLGFGWLPADDDSRATPEEKDYVLASDAIAPDSLRTLSLYWIYFPYPETALPRPISQVLASGRPRVFRVDLPNGDYRVTVIGANGTWDQPNLALSGMVVANGRPVLLDVPLDLGSLARRSFTTRVHDGALELRFGGATGFAVAGLLIDPASHLTEDPLDRGGVREWRVSPRHPNPDWWPLRDVVVPSAEVATDVHAAESGIPLVDLGTLAQAAIGDVVVARAEISRASAGPAELHVGASSAAHVYLNGQLVLELANLKGVERDEGVARVALRAGENRLEVVLKRFWERRWLFYAAVTAP
jgi:hypothetical protein